MKSIIAIITLASLSAFAQNSTAVDPLQVLSGNSLEKTAGAAETEFTQAMTDLQKSVQFECKTGRDGSQGDCTMIAWTCKGLSKFSVGFNAGIGNQQANAGAGGVVIVNDGNATDENGKYAGINVNFSHEWGGGGSIQLPLPTFKLVQTYNSLAARPSIIAEELKKRHETVSATYNLVTQLYGTIISRTSVACNNRN